MFYNTPSITRVETGSSIDRQSKLRIYNGRDAVKELLSARSSSAFLNVVFFIWGF